MVGYLTCEIDSGAGEFMSNIGVPLKNLGAVDGAYTVSNELFSYTCQDGDTVYVFNPDNWNLDFFSYVGFDQGWSASWSDGTVTLESSFVVEPGANLFFMPADGASSVIIAGEVAASGTQQVVFDPTDGDWMWPIVNPFPIDTTLGDIESFAVAGDTIYVFNPFNWNLDFYSYVGPGQGWSVSWSDGSVSLITDSTTVLFPAGTGGLYMPNGDGQVRTWNVTLTY